MDKPHRNIKTKAQEQALPDRGGETQDITDNLKQGRKSNKTQIKAPATFKQ